MPFAFARADIILKRGFVMQWEKKELVKLWSNTDKRREFLKNYKVWGIWLTVEELGLTYYKYELPNGARILAMEYQRRNPYPLSGEGEVQTLTNYYLWEDEYFSPSSASEYAIVDLLKKLKGQLQTELSPNKADAE
jgi:hypothetical protein